MAALVGKWAAGTSYGPVLSQTELYLLKTPLEINPIFAGTSSFTLSYSLVEGRAGGFNSDDRARDLTFVAKDEPATLPRVQELIIITRWSPWCSIVKNERGVTMNDVLSQLWRDYGETYVTDAEFQSLHPRVQEHIKRFAGMNAAGPQYGGYYPVAPGRIKRVDWLRERKYFGSLSFDPEYTASRLGYSASNIFVLELNG